MGCLLYEIVKHNNHQAPLIWGSRVFLMIDVSIVPLLVNERKVAVKLVSVKSRAFIGAKEEIKALHENVLCHFMHTYGQSSQWDIERLGLALQVSFDREVKAKLIVHLSHVVALLKEMPIFYSYGDFM
jgi:hypothetical protein